MGGGAIPRLYGQQIDDIVDTIPIGIDEEGPGNIDQASVYGVEWKATFNMDPIGWRSAKLAALLQHEHSSVRDPLADVGRPLHRAQEPHRLALSWCLPASVATPMLTVIPRWLDASDAGHWQALPSLLHARYRRSARCARSSAKL